ncbi:hypothetical protein U1Q18_009263, partial [Sarracenia purpurea var. burkii]
MHFKKNSARIWVKAPTHPSLKSKSSAPVSESQTPPPASRLTEPVGPSTSSPLGVSPPAPSHDIPSASEIPTPTPTQSTPPPPAVHTPASSSAAPMTDPAVLARLDAMEASNLGFQTKVLKDLAYLKKAQLYSSKMLSNMQIFMEVFMPKHLQQHHPSQAQGLRPQGQSSQPAAQGQAGTSHAQVPVAPMSSHMNPTQETPISAFSQPVQEAGNAQEATTTPAAPIEKAAAQVEEAVVPTAPAKKGEEAAPLDAPAASVEEVEVPAAPAFLAPSAPSTAAPAAPAAPESSSSDIDNKRIEEDLQGLLTSTPLLDPSSSPKPLESLPSAPSPAVPPKSTPQEIDSDIEITNPHPLKSQPPPSETGTKTDSPKSYKRKRKTLKKKEGTSDDV